MSREEAKKFVPLRLSQSACDMIKKIDFLIRHKILDSDISDVLELFLEKVTFTDGSKEVSWKEIDYFLDKYSHYVSENKKSILSNMSVLKIKMKEKEI